MATHDCEHAACACKVEAAGQYCSDECAEQGPEAETCDCGHSDCES